MLTNKSTFVFFRLEKEVFAINVKHIIQTMEMTELTALPETPVFMKGITIFRGGILPVIDLRLKFQLDKLAEDNNGFIVVTKYKNNDKTQQIGFVVDKIIDVSEFSELDINDFPEIGSKYNIEFINGVIKRDEKVAIILNIQKVLSSVEVEILKRSTEKVNLLKQEFGENDKTD